jgi:hypothetical protein
MKLKSIFFLTFTITLFSLSSCNKYKPSTMGGDNSIIYESPSMNGEKMTPSKFGNIYYIDNVAVYTDIYGVVSDMATSGMTNDKPNWVKDIVIQNIKLSDYFRIKASGLTGFGNLMTDCKLIYSYYPIDNSGEKKVILAMSDGYDNSTKEVKMISMGQDLTALFKENKYNSGKLYLDFKFNDSPNDYVYINYYIPFDYSYQFTNKEASKKE